MMFKDGSTSTVVVGNFSSTFVNCECELVFDGLIGTEDMR